MGMTYYNIYGAYVANANAMGKWHHAARQCINYKQHLQAT